MKEFVKSQTAFRKELNEKTDHYIHILDVQQDPRFLKETEGILKELNIKLDEKNLDVAELVKRAWKGTEDLNHK